MMSYARARTRIGDLPELLLSEAEQRLMPRAAGGVGGIAAARARHRA